MDYSIQSLWEVTRGAQRVYGITGVKPLPRAGRYAIRISFGYDSLRVEDEEGAREIRDRIFALREKKVPVCFTMEEDAEGVPTVLVEPSPVSEGLYKGVYDPGKIAELIGKSLEAWRMGDGDGRLSFSVADAALMSGFSESNVRKAEHGYYGSAYLMWAILNGYPVEDLRRIVWSVDKEGRTNG